MPDVQLDPKRKSEIADLLSDSYECINPSSHDTPTTAQHLKSYPKWYLGIVCSQSSSERRDIWEKTQKKMDWASWEIARSTLDESMKNSIGILLYLHKIKDLWSDPISGMITSIDRNYISSFILSSLYFSHLHMALSGLSLAGIIQSEGRFMVRDVSSTPRWKCINDSWQECWEYPGPHHRHVRIFRMYDAIQRHHTPWLPRRPDILKSLKKDRESITYHIDRLGGWPQGEAVRKTKEAFPHHATFQEQILGALCGMVEDGTWNRSYNPKARTQALSRHFDQYWHLARYVLM